MALDPSHVSDDHLESAIAYWADRVQRFPASEPAFRNYRLLIEEQARRIREQNAE